MTASSIAAAKGGGYARYLEGKTIEPERGDYYLAPGGEPAQARARILAGKAQTREQAETVKREWQPRVRAQPFIGAYKKPVLIPDQMAVPYFLSNDGTGPAFNVEYGIELSGQPGTPSGHLYRVLRAREEAPTKEIEDEPGKHWLDAIVTTVMKQGMSEDEIKEELVYWAWFDNLIGERFEVRNPHDVGQPAEFREIGRATLAYTSSGPQKIVRGDSWPRSMTLAKRDARTSAENANRPHQRHRRTR